MVRKGEPPSLILFPNNVENVCVLYNPEEDIIYKTKRDFPGTRFIGNSGKWFLVVDSEYSSYKIDVFSDNRIHLPTLESLLSSDYTLKRVGDKE